MSLNLTALVEKYDPVLVEEDLNNLQDEIADEIAIEVTLDKDSAEKTDAIIQFIENNKIIITDQHKRMRDGVALLKKKVASNMNAEEADEEYYAVINSDEALDVARMLAELDAMSAEYHALLLNSGRVGRPPL